MTNELVLNASSYGIEESKAKQLEKVFIPMVEKFKELEEQYNEVLANKVITKEVCANAKVITRKYVKVRTETDDRHKIAKKSNLIEGRAIDGLKNLVKYACNDHEESLKKVSNHFERSEAEKLEKLREQRNSILEKYDINPGVGDPALMSEDIWKHYINSVELDHNAKVEAEKKAEAERIAKEKAEIAEQKRIKAENERLKKEAELKLIADEKAEKERQRLAKIEQDKRDILERERLAKAEAERKEREAEEAKERAYHEAELKKEREEKELIQKELQAKAEAERKREEANQLELIRIEKENKAKQEEERLLALAPIKDKLKRWINKTEIKDPTEFDMDKETFAKVEDIMLKFNSFKTWAKAEIDKI